MTLYLPHENKYRNKRTIVDNITFQSRKEAQRYLQLKLLLRGKEITELRLQPRFTLQESFTDVMGVKHREIVYVADFIYKEIRTNVTYVEDAKGMRTKDYLIKKKLFLYEYPQYRFKEV